MYISFYKAKKFMKIYSNCSGVQKATMPFKIAIKQSYCFMNSAPHISVSDHTLFTPKSLLLFAVLV